MGKCWGAPAHFEVRVMWKGPWGHQLHTHMEETEARTRAMTPQRPQNKAVSELRLRPRVSGPGPVSPASTCSPPLWTDGQGREPGGGVVPL